MNTQNEVKHEPARGWFARSLDAIETVGNRLPHPATLFGMLAVVVALASVFFAWIDFQAIHPVGGKTIAVKSLLGFEGLRWMYSNILKNFLNFPPLGYVLVVMVGIGVAEGAGLFTLMIRALVLSAPAKFITPALVLAGIISHLASEAGYVILIPLGAAIFHALGRLRWRGWQRLFAGSPGGSGPICLSRPSIRCCRE